MAIPLKPSLRVSPPRSNVPLVGWDWREGCPRTEDMIQAHQAGLRQMLEDQKSKPGGGG
jgi:hypothetical protein